MARRIDRESVFQMARMGFTAQEIANRLNCSLRQVKRIKIEIQKSKNISLDARKQEYYKLLKDPDCEDALRRVYMVTESAEKASKRFGVSRQAMLK